MSEYIVSARKYRPQTFDTVVGQEHITTTLKNAIRHQHLAHAYLFCGPRGVGKTTCARILAKTINCQNPTPELEACGVCDLCVSFKNNTTFNIFELDAASNNSVEDIRELTAQVRFTPQQGKYKVYIIDEVHMLSAAAFNAFLKTLEEPPPFAIFILATTEKHKILPTILSRCQIFDFKRITTTDIVTHLQYIAAKEGMTAQEAALHVIARKSEGCMRDALSMIDRIAGFTNGILTYSNTVEHLNLLDADFYFSLVDLLLGSDIGGTLLMLDHALEKGFEGEVIIDGLAEHLRNLLLCKDGRMAKLLDVPNDYKPVYYEKANQSPPSFILSALNVINDCQLGYKSANNKRLHTEMCLIRLCYLLKAVSGAQVTVSDEKKNSNSDADPLTPPTDNKTNAIHINESVVSPVAPVIHQPIVTPVQQSTAQDIPDQVPIATRKTREQATSSFKKLNKNLLKDLDVAISNAATAQENVERSLSDEFAGQLFEKYKQRLQSEGKNMIHAQLCLMHLQVLPPDEVHMICPTQFTESYAKDQKNALIDFYLKETGFAVRITTEIHEDEAVLKAQTSTVLSKTEMYESMAQRNPNIAKLKEALGMQIEY